MVSLERLWIYAFTVVYVNGGTERFYPRKCQEITIPMCKGIGYNETYMPNQFNHDNQEEAGMEVHQFWPLVEIQCSPDLQFFLCSIYTPICMDNYHKPLPACRSVCERAKSGCAPLMKQYGFGWPERMKCEDLPEYGDRENLCMDSNTSTTQTTTKKPVIIRPPTAPDLTGLPPEPEKKKKNHNIPGMHSYNFQTYSLKLKKIEKCGPLMIWLNNVLMPEVKIFCITNALKLYNKRKFQHKESAHLHLSLIMVFM